MPGETAAPEPKDEMARLDEVINQECGDGGGVYADKSLGLWSCEVVRHAGV